jgi:hypothetical protein
MRAIWILGAIAIVLLSLLAGCANQQGEWLPPAEATATYEAARAAIVERRAAERTQTASARQSQPPTVSPTSPVQRATATPRPSPTPATIAAAPETTFAQNVSALQGHMPIVSQVGEWYWIPEEGPRSAEAIAAAYPDPDVHRARLAEWGFQRAAYRRIEYLSEGPNDLPFGLHLLDVTVSEYDTPEHAAAALDWEVGHALEANPGLAVAERETLADTSVVLSGQIPSTTGGPEAWTYVWVRIGHVVLHARGVADRDQTLDVWGIIQQAVNERPNALGAPLPTLADLPAGFYVYAEEPMAIEDAALQFEEEVNPREHLTLLQDWGYQNGFFKVFGGEGYQFTGPLSHAPSQDARPSTGVVLVKDEAIAGIVFIGMSVSEYASAEAAAAAAQYHWTIVRDSDPNGYREVQVLGLGDNAWGLGSRDGGSSAFANMAVIFMQHSNREYMLIGISMFDNTVIDLVAIARETMNRQ